MYIGREEGASDEMSTAGESEFFVMFLQFFFKFEKFQSMFLFLNFLKKHKYVQSVYFTSKGSEKYIWIYFRTLKILTRYKAVFNLRFAL